MSKMNTPRIPCLSPAPIPALPSPPTTPPPAAVCRQIKAHPLHTFTINSLCPVCQEERDARVQAFELHMRDNLERRILNRSAKRDKRISHFAKGRLFRASTTLAMIMENPIPVKRRRTGEDWDSHSQAETLRTQTSENVGRIVDDIRRRVRWTGSETVSSPTGSGQGFADLPLATPSSPSTPRLSFAAFGGNS